MRKLEVATLTANLRTNQKAGSLFLRKVCGGAITLQQGHAFVEKTTIDIDDALKFLEDFFSEFPGPTNQQHLRLTQLLE